MRYHVDRANGACSWLCVEPVNANLITEDTHARRSRLLYQKALGKSIKNFKKASEGKDEIEIKPRRNDEPKKEA